MKRYILLLMMLGFVFSGVQSVFSQIDQSGSNNPNTDYFPGREIVNSPLFGMSLQQSKAVTAPAISVTPLQSSGYTATTLVQNVLVSGCLQASNVVYTGNQAGLGTFNANGSGFPIGSGIILATGNVTNAIGPNQYTNRTTEFTNNGDADLNIITGSNSTRDAAVLEFDFIPAGNMVQFKYVFASEEYPEWACSQFNDVFAFLLSGPGINGAQGFSNNAKNIALLPDGITPVTINNIHVNGWNQNVESSHNPVTCPNKNAIYYSNNIGGTSIEYDGSTVVLTAQWQVVPCQTYHIKLAIADVADRKWDSGVMIEGSSFTSNPVTMKNYDMNGNLTNDIYEGCAYNFVFDRTGGNTTSALTINYSFSGTAITGDHSFPTGSITIPANQNTASIPFSVIADALAEGSETLIISIGNGCPCNQNSILKTLTLHDHFTVSTSHTNIMCSGANDGTITVATSGGTGSFQYSLNGGTPQSSNIFTGLASGSYVVTATNGTGCPVNSSSVVIVNPPQLTGSAVISQGLLCNGATNAVITVTAAGGTGAYSYSLNGGLAQASNVFSGLAAGTYTVTVYDANNCTAVANAITIANPAMLTASAQGSSQVSCYNAQDGQITVTAAGGTGAYSYSLNGGLAQVSNVFSGLAAGTYTVTVYDANNCSAVANAITIANPAMLTASAQGSSQVSCYNAQDGQITVTAAGGTGAYSYSLNGGLAQASNVFSGLAAGTYTVTVYDANNCSAVANAITIANPAMLTASAQGSSQVSCYNAQDGQITVTAAGGTGAYSYSLNGGLAQASNVFSGLAAGTYTVTVYDANNCTAVANAITITNPAMLTASAQGSSQVSCYNAQDGQITVTAAGGTGAYSYSLNGGPAQASNMFSGLAAGTYTVTVYDANNCSAVANAITIANPAMLTASAQGSSQVSCYNAQDGQITVTAAGGTGAYSYSLNGGLAQASSVFSGLAAGTYTVTVYDANNCSAFANAITITNPAMLTASAQGSSQVSCYNAQDGQITVTAAGGTGAYSYSLNGGPAQASSVFSGLAAGTYTVTVYDANNCSAVANAITIANPAMLTASAQGSSQVSCYNAQDGQITVTAAGGTGAYSYSLNGGLAQASNVFSGLASGTYTVTVYDANNCSAVANAITIANPAMLTASAQGSSQVSCYNAADGTISVAAIGGTGTYTYSLNGGPAQVSNVFSGLAAGTYTITVFDANGCFANAETLSILNPVMLTVAAQGSAQVSCFHASDGQITASANGGTGAYVYSLNGGPVQVSNVFSGLTAGTYTVTVYDANECMAVTNAVTIADPAILTAVVQASAQVSCYNGEDGKIIVVANGGTGAYTYSLNGGPVQSLNVFDGLSSGTYVITVYDANNCSFVANAITIINPEQLKIIANGSAQLSCYNANDGQITISAVGGTGAYSYSLNGGPVQSSNIFSGLAAGTYVATVYDANNCMVSAEALIIGNPLLLVASAEGSAQVSCYNAEDGQITVYATGGTGYYSYSLNGGPVQSSNVFENLAAGSYIVTVYDANQCMAVVEEITIDNPAPVSIYSVTTAPVSCFGGTDGQITVTANGGTGNYVYYLSSIGSQSSNVFSGLYSGSYSLTVFDQNSCQVGVENIFVDSPAMIYVSIEQSQLSCFGEALSQVVITAGGGTAPYSYSIDGGETFSTSGVMDSLKPGVIVVEVVDSHGCSSGMFYFTVEQKQLMDVTVNVISENVCGGISDAIVSVLVEGGTGPYNFSMDNTAPQLSSYYGNLGAGNHILNVYDQGGCRAEVTFDIKAQLPLKAEVVSITDADCSGTKSGAAEIAVEGGVEPYAYDWNNSANTPYISNVPAGAYTVTVTDANGCELKFPINVNPGVVYDDIELHNVFSPNGDGVNDTWVVNNLGFYPENELVVINRWGNEVYSQQSYQSDWNGSDLLEGTYFYILNVNMCGEDKSFNGYITIVR